MCSVITLDSTSVITLIVGKEGIIVEVMEVVGVEGSRVLFERFRPPHDTV